MEEISTEPGYSWTMIIPIVIFCFLCILWYLRRIFRRRWHKRIRLIAEELKRLNATNTPHSESELLNKMYPYRVPKKMTEIENKPFKLMHLPTLVFQQVADCWDLQEKYTLSQVSQKSKIVLSLANKKRLSKIDFHIPSTVYITYRHSENPFRLELDCYSKIPKWFYYPEKAFELISNIEFLFDSHLESFHFDPKKIAWQELYKTLKWINSHWNLPFNPDISIQSYTYDGMFFKILMESLEKNVDHFTISGMEYGSQSIKFCHNFEIDWLNVNDTLFLDVDAFTSLKFSRAYLYNVDIANEEINEILMSWKMGRFGDKMESITVEKMTLIDLRAMLVGLEAELRDPRITKRSKRLPNGTTAWIHGGIYFNGPNGKTATINLYSYQSAKGDDRIPEESIQEYETIQRSWNAIVGNNGEVPHWGGFLNDLQLFVIFQ
ncbi:hypothetical protein GCK72_003464 [Caenorhabditis remanei]|uniref:F-box domain-containing protein n=1 Tax=Caenorhabditis remanei TaxID=31234 RepID=A0A6A5HY90_CAERE|nr:hypothetical protein GCK72_003464 [Caenorhabditis remanei]KAF1771637.1 hypothetical protein GCK72_003464 [Caenorhabditis remanei]